MYNIKQRRGLRYGLTFLFALWLVASVFGQSPVDTIPVTGQKNIQGCTGFIVPTTDANGYCITNNNGSITINPPAGCGVHLEGSYIITDFTFNGVVEFKDHIYIYNGLSTSSPLLADATDAGYVNVTSTGPMTIKFTTNYLFQYNEFRLKYSCVAGCGCENDYPLTFSWNNDILTVEWIPTQSGASTGYTLEYGPDGFVPGTGTVVSGITEPRYNIAGLIPKNKYNFRLLYPCAITSNPVTGSYTIPENIMCIDMRDLNRSNITCTYGGYGATGNPYEHIGIVASHHNVVPRQSFDPYTGGLLQMIPDGETYSVKLGNAKPAESESIAYTYTVDTTIGDIILLKYAAIMELPNHTLVNQPRFDLEILDQSGRIVDANCGQAQFISSQSLGWNEFHYRSASGIYNGTQPRYDDHDVLWKDWTNIGFNVSAYHGQTITIRLTNRDCGEGAHWGFAYFNLGCMKRKLTVEQCGDAVTNTFTAPAGFNYNWYYTDDPSTIIGTGQSITVPVDSTRMLACEVSDLEGNGCGFQLQGVLHPIVPESDFDIVRTPCSRHYTFHNNSIISNGTPTPYATECESAYWNFGDGTTSQAYNATHTYAQPGTYTVTLVSGMNLDACLDTLRKTLVVPVDTTDFRDTACVEYWWNGQRYDASGDYTQHIPRPGGLCDSVVTLYLIIYPEYEHFDTVSLCGSDLPYTYGDTAFLIESRTGDYPILFHSQNGCDSLIHLRLIVNPPYSTRDTMSVCPSQLAAGIPYGDSLLYRTGTTPVHFLSGQRCDSTVWITLLPLSNTYDTVRVDTCDLFTWINGRTYTQSATDTVMLTNAAGCDSIVTLLLNIRYSTAGVDTIIACNSYHWINDSTYSASTDTPTFTLTNAAGCDSVVTLHLTIHPVYEHNDTVTLCGSDLPYTYGDSLFPIETRTGDHRILFHTQQGCDSVIRLHLVVNPPYSTHDTLTVCQSDLGNGIPYGESLLTGAGTTPVHFLSGQQCDSTVWVTLWVPVESYDTVRVDTCDLYTWTNGRTYTSSASDTMVLTNAAGCDSIVTLLLNIRHTTAGIDTITACGSYRWINDSIYTESTTAPTFTLTNSENCDSIVTLHLTIHPEYLHNNILHICRNELPYIYSERLTIPVGAISNQYRFNDTTLMGCDSITIVNVFIHENPHDIQNLTLPDSALPHYYQPLDTLFEVGSHSGDHLFHFISDSYPYCDSVVELHLTIELWAQTFGDINTQCNPDAQHPCNGWASVNVRGGKPPYTYLWDDPQHQTTDTAFNLCEGDYQVTITDSLGAVLVKPYHVGNYISDTSVVFDTIGTSQIPYQYHGYTFQQPVNNTFLTIQNSQGCDSLVLYSLYIRPNDTLRKSCTLCNDFPAECEGKVINRAGTTVDSILLANQSYLIRIFQVDTFLTPRSLIYDTACAPYIWNGHTYTESGVYRDTLVGSNNCDSIVTLRLTITDFPNPINNIQIPDICVGDTGIITIGHNPSNSIYYASEEDARISLSETTFLPDGQYCNNSCAYQSSIHFANFPATSVIRDVNDIRYVRLNLEHTWAGDLYIKITCPSFQSADILKFSRTSSNTGDSPCIQNIGAAHRGWQAAPNGQSNADKGTDFGIPNTSDHNPICDANQNPPGTGWNYCWSNNTNQGYQYGNTNSPNDDIIYREANVQRETIFGHTLSERFKASNIANGTHFYKPDQSFQSLVNCPLNGDWTITVIDGWKQDNGYLFSWELALTPELLNVSRHPIDSTMLTGLWSDRRNDSTYWVTPPATITQDTTVQYLITVFSNYGCHFDTIVSIHYRAPKTTILHDTICRTDLPFVWEGHNITDTGYYRLTSMPHQAANGCDSTAILHLIVLDTTVSTVTEQIGEQQLPHAFNGCWFHHAVTDTVIIIENHLGCDSLIHYTLLIFDNTSDTLDTIVCREALPLTWHNHLFTLTDTIATDTSVNANHSYHITHYHVHTFPVLESRFTHPLTDICAGHTDSIRIGTSPQSDIQLSYAGISDSIPIITSITADGRWLSGNGGTYTITPPAGLSQDSIVTYHFHAVNSLGCTLDNTFTMQMTTSIVLFRNDTLCHGALPYIHLNDTIREPGTYALTPELHPSISDGCDTILNINVTILDSINPIASVNIPSICAGDTAIITISYNLNAGIQLTRPNHTIYFPEPIFLPDDLDCPIYGNIYRSPLIINSGRDNAQIRNANDIRFVRLKIEHSAIEDLRILLRCPSGDTAVMLPSRLYDGWPGQDPRGNNTPFQNIGRINMGVANRIMETTNCNPATNPIGIPWNYVWSNNTDQGYNYAGGTYGYLYEIPNIHFTPNPLWDNSYNQGNYSYKVDSSDVHAGTQFYHPKESFQQLVGCPVNGTWQIQVEDREIHDNGYLTEWELSLAPDLFAKTVYSIVQKQLTGPWIQPLSDSTFRVTPPITLPHDTTILYQLTTINERGCRYDTLIALHFKTPHRSDTIITQCDSLQWRNRIYTVSGTYIDTLVGTNGCDSTVYLHLTIQQSLRDTIRDTICIGNPYVRHGFNLLATETANTGTFTHTRRHGNAEGCDSIITLLLKVNDYPTLVTCGDTVILFGGSAALWVTGADSCKWLPSETLSSAFTLQTTATPSQSTLYRVIGYNWNCSSHDSVQVLINRDIDTSICPGALPIVWHGITFNDTLPKSTILFNPNGLDDAITMHLHYFQTQDTIVADTVVENLLPFFSNGFPFYQNTDTLFVLTDHNGCDSLVHYSLRVLWNSADTLTDETCWNELPFIWLDTALYESSTVVRKLQAADGTDSILVFQLTVLNSYDTTIISHLCEGDEYHTNGFNIYAQETMKADTLLRVRQMQTIEGCDSIIRLNVNITHAHPIITPLIGDFCYGASEILSVDDIYTDYLWSTGETTPSITVTSPGEYTVTVIKNNCSGTDHYLISPCVFSIYLPNAITPSLPDGNNDYFYLDERTKNLIDGERFNIRIFNRWGELVFYSNDKSFKWDGSYNGKIFYNNVYVYKITCYDKNGERHTLKGTITVL